MAANFIVRLAALSWAGFATAQVNPAVVYNTGFNSSFKLTPAQIESAQLNDSLVQNIETIFNFDKTQLVFGGPGEDDFYKLPPGSNRTGPLQPGEIIKVQEFTDPLAYAIPPNTALSRILYTTTNYNGTVVPASAVILWPYMPRPLGGAKPSLNESLKAPVVVWAHGTSGYWGAQGPSANRALYYGHSSVFALAQAGYAVFAPDYAGLGIDSNGTHFVPHQYFAAPAQAFDLLYGFRAALKAFPKHLDKRFVIMGHSQGGGVAWATAELLAKEAQKFKDLLSGYRGTISASPITNIWAVTNPLVIATVGTMLPSIFPPFQLDTWLTPIGIARTKLAKDIQGGIFVLFQLLYTRNDIFKPEYVNSWYAQKFAQLMNPGRKPFSGPLLVIQGTTDVYVPLNVTTKTVEDTQRLYPSADLEYVVAHGAGHTPALDATRQIWMQWIEERLEGKALKKKGPVRTDLKSFLPDERYLHVGNAITAWVGLPQYDYQVPLGL